MKPKLSIRRFFPLSAIVLAGALAPHAAKALTYTWTPTAAGTYDWNSGTSNWTSGFPNNSVDVVNLNINRLGDQIINLNQAISVNTLNLGDTASTYYTTTIAAGTSGSLTMTSGGLINKATVANTAVDTISANMTLAGDLTVNNLATASTGAITLSGTVSGANAGWLIKGGAGYLNLNGATTLKGMVIGNTAGAYRGDFAAGTVTAGSGSTLTLNGGSSYALRVHSTGGSKLDVSAASSFTANVGEFWIGGYGSSWNGTLNLSTNNTITAATAFRVGDGNAGSSTATGTVTTVAGGTTTIHTPIMKIGYIKANTGTFTLGSGHTLNLDGISGGRAQVIVADATGGTGASGSLDLAAGIANLTLSQLSIAKTQSTGTVTLSANALNHLDIEGAGNTVVVGSSNTSGASTGTLTIGFVDSTSRIKSTDNGTAILIGEKLSTGTPTGNLNLNGGTLTITTTGAAIAGGGGTSNLVLGGATGSGMTLKAGATSSDWIKSLTTAKIKTTGVTIDTDTYNITIGQALLADATDTGGGMTKAGAGTLTLSGVNTYTGPTNVTAGKLAITGAGSINTTSSITVAPGATFAYNSSVALTKSVSLSGSGTSNRAVLGGTGPINFGVTLDNVGDVLSPGNSPGIQTYTPAQTWASFSYDWEINNFIGTTAGTDFDQIAISNTLNLTGGTGAYILNVLSLTAGNVDGNVPSFSEINRSWNILTSTGITGFNAANWTIVTDPAGPGAFTSSPTWGGTWSLGQSGNNLVLNYTAVPEPGAALIGGLGLLVLLRRRR